MSVCMMLYKVLPDVKYNGYYLDFATNKDFNIDDDGFFPIEKKEQELGAPKNKDGHWPCHNDPEFTSYNEWCEQQKANAWSDGIKHDMFDLTYYKMIYGKYRGWGRLIKRLNEFKFNYFQKHSYVCKYLTVDTVEYAQGWFFKKSFYKKDITWTVCTTKDQMKHFFDQYIDCNNRTYPIGSAKFHDNRGKEVIDRFLSSWEDGMLFMCSW